MSPFMSPFSFPKLELRWPDSDIESSPCPLFHLPHKDERFELAYLTDDLTDLSGLDCDSDEDTEDTPTKSKPVRLPSVEL